MQLSAHQKEQIALATLALERRRIGVFAISYPMVDGSGWQVGVSIPSVGSEWPNKLVTIAVVNWDDHNQYMTAIEAYLDELYKEREAK